ncbi:hypothetical protein C4566_02300 [Candidatus Parcubacteria bacterium]|nr:MAG: hypothetical protein C4566_02300 [Candidatus Parcubacteria bacterium]
MKNEFEGIPQQEPKKPKSPEILKLPEVRISAASFSRIKDSEGRLALLVNFSMAKKGTTVLTPIGGGIKITPEGLGMIKDLLDIDETTFEKENDLRFIMKGVDINKFREWFLSKQQREADPHRELHEELIDETGLLDSNDLEDAQCSEATYATELADFNPQGIPGLKSLRILEVFDVELKPEAQEKLAKSSRDPNPLIHFVTEEEIRNGQTSDGIKIATVSESLLDAQGELVEFE